MIVKKLVGGGQKVGGHRRLGVTEGWGSGLVVPHVKEAKNRKALSPPTDDLPLSPLSFCSL